MEQDNLFFVHIERNDWFIYNVSKVIFKMRSFVKMILLFEVKREAEIMSIFRTENCPICDMPTGAFSKSLARYNGLFVCQDCTRKLSTSGINMIKLKDYPLEELQKVVGATQQEREERAAEMALFKPTKIIGRFIYFDDTNKKFLIPAKKSQIYDYSDILAFELLEDGNLISKGGVGRAIVGGALFGDVGAIVGSNTGHRQEKICSKLQIKITVNDMRSPTVYINFIESEIEKDKAIYKQLYTQAQEVLSLLSIIVQSNQSNTRSATESQNNLSAADEILKFKKLLDIGVISQEEFDAKKKQLLGL